MRPFYDDLDEFTFSDSMAVSRIRRELQRDERRFLNRRFRGPGDEGRYDDYEDYEDYEDYGDYDEEEIGTHSGRGNNH